MKIILIDDDPIVLKSLETILKAYGHEILAKGYNGNQAVKLYEEHRPDLVLMDIRMEEKSGIEATEEILSKNKDAKILLLTTFNDEEYISKALSLGCSGYILKQNIDGLSSAIEAISKGQTVLDSEIVENIKPKIKEVLDESLTKREIEILKYIAQGFNNKEIANILYLSEGTVRNYISVMLEKLNLRDRTQLAIYYLNKEK